MGPHIEKSPIRGRRGIRESGARLTYLLLPRFVHWLIYILNYTNYQHEYHNVTIEYGGRSTISEFQ